MTIGRRINELRLARDESLQDLAASVGASKTHIWQLEKGQTENPSIALVQRLADHFGVSIAHLTGVDDVAAAADQALERMFRQARALDEHHRKILDNMLQALLKLERHHPVGLTPPSPTTTTSPDASAIGSPRSAKQQGG